MVRSAKGTTNLQYKVMAQASNQERQVGIDDADGSAVVIHAFQIIPIPTTPPTKLVTKHP